MSHPCLSTSELLLAKSQNLSQERKEHLDKCPLCAAALQGLEMSAELEGTTNEKLLSHLPPFTFQSEPNSKPFSVIRSLRWIAACAAVVAICWIGYQYKMMPPDRIAMGDFDFIEQPYQRKVRGNTRNTDLYLDAAKAYTEGDFQKSIATYLAILDTVQSSLQATRGHYELGIAYWKNGNTQQAASELTTARMGEADYYEDATWALAMLYRQTGELAKAVQLFEDLRFKMDGPYMSRAEQALEELRQQ